MWDLNDAIANALPVLGIGETISVEPASSDCWASGLDAVVLGVDFSGREDLIYQVMINAETVHTDAFLDLTEIGGGQTGFVYELIFDAEIEPVIVVGLADEEIVSWFQAVEIVWLTPITAFETGHPPLYVMAPNDPVRWRTQCPHVSPFGPISG